LLRESQKAVAQIFCTAAFFLPGKSGGMPLVSALYPCYDV